MTGVGWRGKKHMKRQSFKDDMSVTDQHNKRKEQRGENTFMARPNNTAFPSMLDDYPWLTLVLSRLALRYGPHIAATDLEMLALSLRHLFQQLETLYTSVLPALEMDEQTQMAHVYPASAHQHHQYHLWNQLRQALRTLERIEVLCHLLNVTVMSMLQTLDHDTAEQQEAAAIADQAWLIADDHEKAWQEAVSSLKAHLRRWQQSHAATPPLAFACADAVVSTLPLEALDEAFQRILERALVLFEDILPGLYTLKAEENEALSIYLLDLLQQNDDMLIRIDTLIEPLDRLIGYYSAAGYPLPTS
jgi:hypothetical protein